MASSSELIRKECILGINTNVRSVHALENDQVLYSCANHVVVSRRDDKTQTFIHQCHPLEQIQLIALCPSRKTIAVVISGKDGPYIILYDALTYRRKKVLRQAEDTADIIGVSFSKDGKQCLILRDAPDYLLSLWNIEKVPKVIVSIRLATPSGKRIQRADMCPSDSRLICVSGNGILRFFKVTDNIFRPVTVNLRREQQNYVNHCWLSSGIVVLGTDKNELVVIQNFEAKAILPIDDWDQGITAMAPFSNGLMIGGNRGSIRLFHETNEEQLFLKATKKSIGGESEVLAFDRFFEPESLAFCLLSSGRIFSFALSNFGMSDGDMGAAKGDDIVPSFHTQYNGEKKIVCISICAWKPIVATGGSDRTLRIWNFKSKTFVLIHDCKDELVSLSLHPMSLQILICTKTYVELCDIHRSALSPTWRKDISTNGSSCFSNGGHYFALSIGEFVQVYNTHTQDLISTLRGHSAPVQSICWKSDDQTLATIGRDGVLCLWNPWSGERLLRHGESAY